MAARNVTELRILRTVSNASEAAIHFEMKTPKGPIQVCDWVVAESAAPRLELDVFEDNLRAQALYRRLGFVVERISEEPVGRPSGQPARLIYMARARESV